MLVTCGLNQQAPIIIYEWKTGSIKHSTALKSPIKEIFVLPDFPENKEIEDEIFKRYGFGEEAERMTIKKKEE
jgi:hypothetical protein